MKKTLSIVAVLALAGSAVAGNDYNGTGGPLPDLSTLSSTINVPDNFQIADASVMLNNLTHTWVGDLQISLQGPGGQTIDLVNRVGVPPGAGDSSDYNGTYTFANAGANIWTTAAGLGSTGAIPSGTYAATTAGSGAPTNGFNSFVGTFSAGNWTLRIQDFAGGDIGNLGSWKLTLTPVPAPSAAALLGLAGLAATRRRR